MSGANFLSTRGISFVALAAVWLLLWWPYLDGSGVLYIRDLTLLAGPLKSYGAERVLAGELPLWMPFVSAGMPYLADPANQTFYPLNVVYWFADSPAQANTWFALAHSALALVGAYVLLHALRLPRPLAVWGGSLYAVSGYVVSISDNMTYLPATAWIPITLFCLVHLRGVARVCVSALAAAPLLLAGDAFNFALLFPAGFVLLRFRGTEASRARTARVTASLGLVALTALALAAVQVGPSLELMAASGRGSGLLPAEGLQWSFPPERIMELVHPFLFGSHYPAFDFLGHALYQRPDPWVDSVYIGALPVLLAAVAVLTRVPGYRPWLIIAAGALLISLGRHLPFGEALYQLVPFLNSQRYPEKLLYWVTLGIVVLATMGANVVLTRRPSGGSLTRSIKFAGVAAVAVALFVSLYIPVVTQIGDEAWRTSKLWSDLLQHPVTHIEGLFAHGAMLIALLSLAAVLNPRHWKPYWAIVLTLAVLDVLWVHRGHPPHAPSSLFTGAPAAVETHLRAGGAAQPRVYFDPSSPGSDVTYRPGRIAQAVLEALGPSKDIYADGYLLLYRAKYLIERLAPATAVTQRIGYLNGRFSPLEPLRNREWEERLGSGDAAAMLAAGGVHYVVTGIDPHNSQWDDDRLREVYRDDETNLRLLAVTGASAQFRLDSPEATTNFDRWSVPGTTARSIVGAGGTVEPISLTPERFELTARAPGGGAYLVTTESYASGWRAWVNGDPAPIALAHNRFMAVRVPGGNSQVTLVYEPSLLKAGMVLSLGTLAAVCIALLLPLHRPRRPA